MQKLQARRPRLILTEYTGGAGDRACRACTIEGAMRAATIRLAHGQYREARIYDERFGATAADRPQVCLAVTITTQAGGLTVRWPRKPHWGDA